MQEEFSKGFGNYHYHEPKKYTKKYINYLYLLLLQLNPHILFFGERLRFINPDGTSYASPFPSVLVILENSHNTSNQNHSQEGKEVLLNSEWFMYFASNLARLMLAS